ncbi:MAG: hypothetical protein H7240_02995 [Glaciimonas sp.]|nr:hypothetical protein [Glaciimonas sp.]
MALFSLGLMASRVLLKREQRWKRLLVLGCGVDDSGPFTDASGALSTAFSRLNYLASDSVRNAQNAMKVLLKFLLLERQQLSLSEVMRFVATTPIFVSTHQRHLHRTDAELTACLVTQLVRVGAVRLNIVRSYAKLSHWRCALLTGLTCCLPR